MLTSTGLTSNPCISSITKYRSNVVDLTVIQPEVIIHHTENSIHGSIINTLQMEETKKAATFRQRLFINKSWWCPTLTWGDPTLPSALNVFTSEFEMGSGGSRSLLPPGKLVWDIRVTAALIQRSTNHPSIPLELRSL